MHNIWFPFARPTPSAACRLFCFAHSGGGASSFARWPIVLNRSVASTAAIDIFALQYPGHETRMSERPHTRMAQLCDEIVETMLPWLDRDFALFGHSMGALVAFEVARALRRRGAAPPSRLFASGCHAPHEFPRGSSMHRLDDQGLIAELEFFGGTPAGLLANAEGLDAFMPVIRADLELYETYCYEADSPLPSAIVALGGASDGYVKSPALFGWSKHTTAAFAAHTFAGGHFYHHEQSKNLLRLLARELTHLTALQTAKSP